MGEWDAPQSASPDEGARIAGTPAVFVNKIYVSPMASCGAKITFAKAPRASGEAVASPRSTVFPQHADLTVLRRLLDWTAEAPGRPSVDRRRMLTPHSHAISTH